MSIYDELEELMGERNYTWSIDGKPTAPSASDIEKAVDKAAAVLYSCTDGSIVEVGRLIIQKTGETHDIYLHIGEAK